MKTKTNNKSSKQTKTVKQTEPNFCLGVVLNNFFSHHKDPSSILFVGHGGLIDVIVAVMLGVVIFPVYKLLGLETITKKVKKKTVYICQLCFKKLFGLMGANTWQNITHLAVVNKEGKHMHFICA
jgi:hypothetical protein